MMVSLKIIRSLAALALIGSAALSHAQLINAGGTITIQPGAKLVVESTTNPGSIDWPPQFPYAAGAMDNPMFSSNEQIGVGIIFPPMAMTRLADPAGGSIYHSGEDTPSAAPIPAYISFVRRGAETFVPVELTLVVRNSEPQTTEDGFSIESEIIEMNLEMPAGGHPYFTTVSASMSTRERGTGLATGRRTHEPAVFAVDSFFDVGLEVLVVGAPGEPFEGVVIDGSENMRLRQTLDAFDGVGFEPTGDADVLAFDDCLNVDNIGSSGLDGVRLYAKTEGGFASRKGYDHYVAMSASIVLPDGSTGPFLPDGGSLSARPFPPPPEPDLPDFPILPARSIVATNNGGTVAVVCSSNAVRASEWLVEVWDGGTLKAVGTAADETTCWSVSEAGFRPVKVRCAGKTRQGNRAMSTSITLESATAVTIAGASAPVVGDRVMVSPLDPQLLIGGINELVLTTSLSKLCISGVEVGQHGLNHVGVGNLIISPNGSSIRGHGIGSSGYDLFGTAPRDGIVICGTTDHLISPGGGGDQDCDGVPPYFAKLRPFALPDTGGSFTIMALDSERNSKGHWTTYKGGGGGGGRIAVDFKGGSDVCRVMVFNDGEYIGEHDVTLGADGETDVCILEGSPRITGCGKLPLGWPWDISCFVKEFDRPVSFTPTGGSPLVGNQLRLLAPGAGPEVVDQISAIQLSATGIGSFEILDQSAGADRPGMLLPPAPNADWRFPGVGTHLAVDSASYHSWDADLGTGVRIRKDVTIGAATVINNTTRRYQATMEVELEGVGGLALSKRLTLPGIIVVAVGPNPFLGGDLQQYGVELQSFQFSLPAGADPDISTMTMSSGGDLDADGDIIVRKIPECGQEIEALLDILMQIDIQGTAGGGAGGGGVSETSQERWHAYRARTTSGGNSHLALGQTQLSSGDGNLLQLDNIGSSGQDGVSIDLPNVEGFTVAFSPVTLDPGGELSFEPRGDIHGASVGKSFGRCVIGRSPAGGAEAYNIGVDISALGASGTLIEVYDAGQLVARTPGGPDAISLSASPTGAALPAITKSGKLSGRSATPCDVIEFDGQLNFDVPGQPSAIGDEVRLLVQGVQVDVLTNFALLFSGVSGGNLTITEEAMGVSGREIVVPGGGGLKAAGYNSSRSNKSEDSGIAFDPDPDDDNDDDIVGEIELRAPHSVFLPGRHQLWPLTCQLDPHTATFDRVGGSLQFNAFGTINGKENAAYGPVTITYDGEAYQLSGDFSSRGTGSASVAVSRGHGGIDKATPYLYKAVSTGEGTNSVTIRPKNQDGNLPLAEVSAVPELYEPPFEEIECSYRLSFSEEVEITVGKNPPVFGYEIELRLENPTFVSETCGGMNMLASGISPIVINGIGTGPFYGQGLSHQSTGGAHIEEEDPGSRGPLVVHNIGHSGEDGIAVNLDLGEGFWQKIAPLDLRLTGGSLSLDDTVDDDCDDAIAPPDNRDNDCDKIHAVRVSSGGVDSFFDIFIEDDLRIGGDFDVIGTTRGNTFGSSVAVSGDGQVLLAGSIAPQGDGGSIVGYGLLPRTIVRGVGLAGEGFAIEFDAPMVFTPEGAGSPFVCDTLRVCRAAPGLPTGKRYHTVRVGLSDVPQMQVLQTKLTHLSKEEFEALGVGRLIAGDGTLTLDNIGSSGQDGVRVSGRNPQTGKEIKIQPIALAPGLDPDPNGFPTMTLEPGSESDGGLGTSIITLASTGSTLPISANFGAQFGSRVGVYVCDGIDDDCDIIDLAAGGDTVGEIHLISAAPASVIGFGYLPAQPLPGGGQRPAGLYWEFDQPVEITAPGGAAGSGFIGNLVHIAPIGGPAIILPDWLTVLSTSKGKITWTWQDGTLEHTDDWVDANFTPQEIEELDAADYQLDLDDDGYTEIEEFILGLDPKKRDDRSHKPTLTLIQEPAAGEAFAQMSYEFDPTKKGVRRELEHTTDLRVWTDQSADPDAWQLIRIDNLPTGNHRYTWQRSRPIGAVEMEQYRFRGHVTVLK